MKIGFDGRLVDEPRIRAGFIGCGSHSFRNIYPTFQFAPVQLVATCDLDLPRAQAFATQFGADRSYSDYHQMLDKEQLDAVFIVTGYDAAGRPRYPDLACDCLAAGRHVWTEKPPAATTADIERMQQAAAKAGRQVMVGMKKMFFPANEKAKELMSQEAFGRASLAMLQYPQMVPPVEQLNRYLNDRESIPVVVQFLDHLCHPVSLMLFLLGMPQRLSYERSPGGAGVATFAYDDGPVVSLAMTHRASSNGGMERTTIVSEKRGHITIDNNIRVSYHRQVSGKYGASPSFYTGSAEQVMAVWEPEFSLGQLYNKGLFLLGYYGEVNEFARAILENRPISKCTLEHAWQATHIFEAFAQGPGKTIQLRGR